jgi:hypothetical protein
LAWPAITIAPSSVMPIARGADRRAEHAFDEAAVLTLSVITSFCH